MGTIPGANGVIQGCYDSGGNVKVVAALPCPKGYTAFSFYSQSGADSAFLSPSGAASTYLTKSDAAASYLGKTAKAADSDKLDGIDSSGFVQGRGEQTPFFLSQSGIARFTTVGAVQLACTAVNGSTIIFNAFSGFATPLGFDVDVWVDLEGTVSRQTVSSGTGVVLINPFVSGLHHVLIRAFGGGLMGQWDILLNGGSAGTCTANGVEYVAPTS